MINGLNVSCIDHIPTAAEIMRFLPNGGTVRQVEGGGWHQVELVKGQYALTATSQTLYANVAAANAQNLVTLAFGNKLCTPTNMSFPVKIDDKGAIVYDRSAEFAAYAAWMAKNVPNLAAVSIYNEANGSFNDGSPAVRQAEYAMLLRAVVPAVRAANPSVKIIAGASVGWNIDGLFKHIDALFSLKQIDYLDIHPYLNADHLDTFAQQMARIRAAGIVNPAFYTEHGGPNAKAMGPNYWPFFKKICAADSIPPAGANYFLLRSTEKFGSGLVGIDGAETDLGRSWG